MASGSPTQERATDRQCGNCGRWFDARGIDAHEATCDGLEDDPEETDQETETDPEIYDPLADREPTETNDHTETMTETTCSNCDQSDETYSTERTKKELAKRNRLTESNLEKLESHDHYCRRCNRVFDDGE